MREEDAALTLQTTLTPSTARVEPGRRPTHVVGIGASAGGLEALERLFEKMHPETGLAFVVVQHLSPDFKSLTDELLARRTPIPIHRVENGMEVERDAIYLIPPKKDMIIANGRLLLTDKDPAQMMTLPIDHFFRSLAQDQGDRAIGIILSGTGSDGSRGIRDIHDVGGLVMVQAPETAKFDGMPKSALKTGVVDIDLPPEEMPAALLKYIQHPLSPLGGPPSLAAPAPLEGMEAVFRLLREAYDLDFSYYKPATVARRTERRLLLAGAGNIDEYARRLAEDPEELNALYKDLLIGVTRFFRDKEAFACLEAEVLPALLRQAAEGEEFRAWVAGCATGEEAYSLAILVQEQLDALHKPLLVKIFSTDAHRASLEVASAGVYNEASLADLSAARRQRFFTRKGEDYQVTPELRKMIVFAPHNLIKDAPFTKLDLITCRNLLIYLQPPAQKKVLSLFHFGLKTGGVLFLGPSESSGELEDEFELISPRWKLYRKRRDIRLPAEIRLAPVGGVRPRPTDVALAGAGSASLEGQLLGVYDTLLEEFMPPSLLVNENREVLQSFAGGSRYLRLKDGRFSAEVLDMVDAELRMALTGALQRALKDLKPVVYKRLRVQGAEGVSLVNLTVKPIPNRRTSTLLALICFEDEGSAPPPGPPPQEFNFSQASQEHLQSLETELRFTKENLQATIEELETSNEELQASNEELVASNEELQSTNEELHSVNEELYTVNAEYHKKISELTELTADMDNLLVSTQIHTIFLDRKLCIRKFTPKIAETFHLLPQDIGRRIDNFTHTIDHPDLLTDLQKVLNDGQPIEKQVRDRRGSWFLLRILPYQSGAVIEGIVLTLIDIDSLKQAEAKVWRKDQQLAAILRNSPNPVFVVDQQGRYVLCDESFKRLAGCDPVGKTAYEVFPQETATRLNAQNERVLAEGSTAQSEIVLPLPDGPHTYLSVKFPLRDEQGNIIGVGGICTDVTQLKQAEQQAHESARQRERFLAILSHELRNPLAAILNAAAVIERNGTLSGADAEWFRVVERRARHMGRLLDDLLDLSRLTHNKIEIRKEVFDLGTTVPQALEEARPRLEERRQQLIVQAPEQALIVEGDPDRLQQIQVNLLLNAVKYTPVGGRIAYSLQREADQAVIRVRDNGIGISPEMQDKIFDLFVQGDKTPERSNQGIGVGLTLVRSITELHGGRVEVHSDGPDQGSEFVVRLPLALTPTGQASAGMGVPPAATPVPPLRIVLIEDDEDNRQALQMLLELDGHEVRVASNGEDGLTAIAEMRPDVALVDIGLPSMDGYEVARRTRAAFTREQVYLVALTGYGQPMDRHAARDAGFDEHLTKPLKPRELNRVLESIQLGTRSQPSGSSAALPEPRC